MGDPVRSHLVPPDAFAQTKLECGPSALTLAYLNKGVRLNVILPWL